MKLEKSLTLIMRADTGPELADADIEVSKTDMVVRTDVPESYFHQLRLRCIKDAALASRVQVKYQDAGGRWHEIGLGFDDETKWPEDFCQRLWSIETKITQARLPIPTGAAPDA